MVCYAASVSCVVTGCPKRVIRYSDPLDQTRSGPKVVQCYAVWIMPRYPSERSRFQSRVTSICGRRVRGGHVGLLTEQQLTNLFAWQETYPQSLMTVSGRTYWYFQDRFYSENDGLNADQVQPLLLTRQQREQRRIDRAQATVSMGLRRQEQAYRRDVIPDDVKQTSTPLW